ncbi:hypothetical protein SVIOM342S_02576 [Streptomyces violaceorubidus]
MVGQEALALHKAEAEVSFKQAGEELRGVGQVIDLTAHDGRADRRTGAAQRGLLIAADAAGASDLWPQAIQRSGGASRRPVRPFRLAPQQFRGLARVAQAGRHGLVRPRVHVDVGQAQGAPPGALGQADALDLGVRHERQAAAQQAVPSGEDRVGDGESVAAPPQRSAPRRPPRRARQLPSRRYGHPGPRARRPTRRSRAGRPRARVSRRPPCARRMDVFDYWRSATRFPGAYAGSAPCPLRPAHLPSADRLPAPPASTSTCAATSRTSPTANSSTSRSSPVPRPTAGRLRMPPGADAQRPRPRGRGRTRRVRRDR